ncbi:PTS transporter subunit EIIC [Quadrisphaera sp. DSM 44207]|uniref:PTS transporter subunit EIIC n=1 Tax=Quadrisphaera sp. DSM 44207 TaxID=1881057 RepID=UPI000885E298|nr:PTS transporter subunit EIIC [Quadrisphaera sp. DSM 44207]SDQ15405.1 PTS system N-acetylglucosamine-specific IIC component, Glc family [Quadrisphaera sp. DSM 44207]
MASVSADATAGAGPGGRRIPGLAQLQRVGRSLMLPIAVLPAAALLLRLGQDDLLGRVGALEEVAAVIGAAGEALFADLPMLFAVGVAIGFARKADGSTALAAVVGYLVFTGVTDAMSPFVLGAAAEGEEQELVDYGVLGGFVIGLTAALLWQRFYRTALPDYLAFFGGRRLVPIVTAGVAVVLGVLASFLYPAFDAVLTVFSDVVTSSTVLGGFLYGTVNRLLIPLGLHHIVNSVVWFQVGEHEGAQGDIARFFAGDPTAGTFMTGFFPIMMFALPAAAIAIWHEARPAQRKVVGGLMLSAALVSFVTGVTEPLEFSFMFVAFPLYVVHAVLTGTSLALVNALGIRDGFGFSAGAIDYVLNLGIAERPLWIIPIGLGYAVVYYVLFRVIIRRWRLRTPGREDDVVEDATSDRAGRTAGAAEPGAAS